MDLNDLDYRAERICTYLDFLSDVKDLVGQLQYLRNLDEETRCSLRASVFGNEILIAYVRLYRNVRYMRDSELWSPELCVILSYYFKYGAQFINLNATKNSLKL